MKYKSTYLHGFFWILDFVLEEGVLDVFAPILL